MDQRRVISAAIIIPIVILFIHFAPPMPWLALIIVLGHLALKEYHNMALIELTKGDKTFSYLLNATLIAAVYFTESVSFAMFIAFFALAFFHLVKPEDHDDIVGYFLRDLLGAIYCAILPSFIMLIRFLDGKEYIYLLLVTIWAVDTFAYYTGSLIGKNKLIKNISPKKTWEGTIGGTVGAILVVIAAKYIHFSNFSIKEAVVFGVVLSVTGQVGDLFESLLKRAKGIKDSGSLIPGHGGMLDRLDSLLFAAPAFFYFTLFLNL